MTNKIDRKRTSRGAVMVEFALLTPLIFLMMVGAADFVRIFFNAIAVANA